MNAREEILRRIERAAPARPAAEVAASYDRIDRGYLRRHHDDAILDLFAERVADYRATVLRVAASEVASAVAERLAARPGAYGVPSGLPEEWTSSTGAALVRDPSAASLDGLAARSPAARPRSPRRARSCWTTAPGRGRAPCRSCPTTT
ncbi:hypothetical protein [Actinomadura luteofluorescens]